MGSEIILRPRQFCNLSEVVARPSDDYNSLRRKVRIAAILGTWQATLTNFRYLRKEWRNNCEEEALLGVSITGIMDNQGLSDPFINDAVFAHKFYGDEDAYLNEILEYLREEACRSNQEWADRLGINPSAGITCVKPSGTVSQLVDSASGIHPRFSRYYIRRVRSDFKDPLAQFMIDAGFPYEVDSWSNSSYVFSFPMKAPDDAVTADDVDSISQLELWKTYNENWCEHKPSCTVYYKDDNFLKTGQWVWENFSQLSGISFLPLTDHVYKQAPYEAISEERYYELLEEMPKNVDWTQLGEYEKEDNTVASKELACSAGGCEI